LRDEVLECVDDRGLMFLVVDPVDTPKVEKRLLLGN
jgi:hypothetical protein